MISFFKVSLAFRLLTTEDINALLKRPSGPNGVSVKTGAAP